MSGPSAVRKLHFICPFCGSIVWAVQMPNILVNHETAAAVSNSLEQIVNWHMDCHVEEMLATTES